MVSTMPDSLEAQLALGLLEKLDEWGIVTWADAEYLPDAVRPAFLGPSEPRNAPAERVIVTARRLQRIRANIVEIPVGIAWRGPVDGDDLDAINFLGLLERRFYRLPPTTFGAVRVSGARVESAGTLPRDTSRRLAATATILFRARMTTENN